MPDWAAAPTSGVPNAKDRQDGALGLVQVMGRLLIRAGITPGYPRREASTSEGAAMETFLGSMVTICVVAAVMGLLTKSKQDKKTSSIYKFTVRASSAIIFIAVVTMAIPAALLVANFLQGDRTVSVYVCGGVFLPWGCSF